MCKEAGGGGEGARDTESKTRTPHKVVGKKVYERCWLTKLCVKVVCERWCVTKSTPATRNDGGCEIVPRLPRKTKVDVRLCHACHAKCRGVTGVTGDQASPSAPPNAMSATPATQNDGGCEFVPRLPRKTKVDVRLCQSAAASRASRATKPVQARHPMP